MRFATRVMLLVSAAGLFSLSPFAFGQAVYGSIFGTVTDATGAAVPGANVAVTDVAKGTSFNVQSNEAGEFRVDHLIPDIYDVKVDASGFKGYQQRGIQLFADTSVKVAAGLTAGGSDITGEVRADEVPQLKTDLADVATILGSK